MQPRIYQLFVRIFGNTKGANVYDGDIATNGCGTFEDINDVALDGIKQLGVTHIWLTGVVRQATLSDFSSIDPALGPDDPDIVKGRAGSPYAIKDYFDVSPELAQNPAQRIQSFQALLNRIHDHGLKAVIDLVPNHVSRAYSSTVRPDLNFGTHDDQSQFFVASNNFFYLVDPAGEALQLSYPQGAPPRDGLDGRFAPEDNSAAGRVPKATGNNQTSHTPSANDWYEAIKLNYGFNFVDGTTHYSPIPDTWNKIDAVLAYWQGLGVDGFRCDFSHWIPVEFWSWAIARAKARGPVYFFAETYDNPDAAPGYSKQAFVQAGFDALYDSNFYNTIKGIFAASNWANDLDGVLPSAALSGHMLRYVENHDERRAASPVTPGDPGNSGFGSASAGFVVTALAHTLGAEPSLLYNGQEVGEPALGAEGFGGDDGRTTIFDYWTMPMFASWVDGHTYDGALMTSDQQTLRANYVALGQLLALPAFAAGKTYSLQSANKSATEFGGQGQFVYAVLRTDPDRASTFLMLFNLSATNNYRPQVRIPSEALNEARLPVDGTMLTFNDHFSSFTTNAAANALSTTGVEIDLPALAVRALEIKTP